MSAGGHRPGSAGLAVAGPSPDPMVISYEEAFAELTGPGRTFELCAEDIDGVPYRVFTNAPATLVDVFAASREDESTFLVYEDERWSFQEARRHIDALAHTLVHTFGVQKGHRVGIAMRNLPEWIVSFAAILSIGAVSVSFNAWWTESELDYALEDSGSVVLIVDGERVERAHGPAAQRRGPGSSRRGSPPENRSRPACGATRTSSRRAIRCRPPSCCPRTTPPSSTRRGRPGSPRGRCPPIGRSPSP